MLHKHFHFIVLIALVLVIVGCKPVRGDNVIQRPGEPDVIGVESTDKEMVAAIQKAKDTVGQFIEELKKPQDRYFSIKFPLKGDDGNLEHIWVENIIYANGVFKGTLANDPYNIKGKKFGDAVEVRKEDISDWLIAKGPGEPEAGGFTTKVIESKLFKP